MQSTNNQTNVPLRAGAIFLGGWDDALNYDGAYCSITSDQNCQLDVYQSNDKRLYTVTSTNYTGASGLQTYTQFLEQRYMYITVRNSSSNNQTLLNVSLIYKNNSSIEGTVNVANFPTSQNSNVFDSAGSNILSTGNAMNVFVTNTIQESNQAVNLCSGTGTNISSTGNYLDTNITNSSLAITGSVTADVNLIGGDALYLGANSGTNSIPVVIANDQ